MSVKELIISYSHFKENGDEEIKIKLNKLAHEKQNPSILFITCIDSRIDPSMFFGENLGDMFVVRNPGNFVVPYSKIYSGIGASIEFALEFFNITDIIICGHSQCGACETIFKNIDIKDNMQLRQWLEQNKIIRKRQFFTNNPEEQFEKESLLQQSKNIKTYPIVKKHLGKTISLHSWYVNIKTSIIYRYDGDKFVELQV
jgi:carbonic anhydrase